MIVERGVLAPAATMAVTALIGWRLGFAWVARQVGPRERLLLVGTGTAAFALARELQAHEEDGVEIVGFVDAEMTSQVMAGPLAFLGTFDDIPALVRARSVDRVVVSLADARGKLPMDKLLEMKLRRRALRPPRVGLRGVHREDRRREPSSELADLLGRLPQDRTAARRQARPSTSLGGAVGLMLSAPIVALLAVAIKLTSPGPVFYHAAAGRPRRPCLHRAQVPLDVRGRRARHRSGVDARRRRSAHHAARPLHAPHAARRAAAVLERFCRGHMSLVGPAPGAARVRAVSSIEQIPFYGQRHVVKPGLTGWAQVRYTYGATVEDAIEKLQYDLFYIKNMSVGARPVHHLRNHQDSRAAAGTVNAHEGEGRSGGGRTRRSSPAGPEPGVRRS